MGELEKALLKAAHPSVFFRVLEEMGQVNFWFGGYARLTAEERTETDALLDNAALRREQARSPLYFMLSALCLRMREARDFIERLSGENDLREYVENMCALCGRARRLSAEGDSDEQWNFLFDASVCPEDLLLLAYCADNDDAGFERAQNQLAEFERLMGRPYVMGRDLIEAGLKPDKNFSGYLKFAHGLRLKGTEKSEALKKTLEYAKK